MEMRFIRFNVFDCNNNKYIGKKNNNETSQTLSFDVCRHHYSRCVRHTQKIERVNVHSRLSKKDSIGQNECVTLLLEEMRAHYY